MADIKLLENHYIETDFQGLKDKCIESPLPIALIVNSLDIRMKFSTLIKSHHWLSVEMTLLSLYPEQKESIDGYRTVFDRLQIIEPAIDEMLIVLSEHPCDIDDQNDSATTYVDVSDRKLIPEPDSLTDSHALEFVKWENWLGMDLAPETVENFNELEIIAHCLYEMTFYGYDQDEIQGQLSSLKSMMEDFQNLPEEERSQETISLEDFLKELDENSDNQEGSKALE